MLDQIQYLFEVFALDGMLSKYADNDRRLNLSLETLVAHVPIVCKRRISELLQLLNRMDPQTSCILEERVVEFVVRNRVVDLIKWTPVEECVCDLYF